MARLVGHLQSRRVPSVSHADTRSFPKNTTSILKSPRNISNADRLAYERPMIESSMPSTHILLKMLGLIDASFTDYSAGAEPLNRSAASVALMGIGIGISTLPLLKPYHA